MPTTVEAIEADIDAATVPGFRNRLIARGQARAMVWRDGVLPPEAPAFTPQLSNDLLGYGYALLEMGIRLRDKGGDPVRARVAFEQAATAIEAVIARGPRGGSDRSFHFVVGAASYHLARLSARAYSLLNNVIADASFSRSERALALLMLRDLDELETLILAFRVSGAGSDRTITASLENQLLVDELLGRPEGDDPGFVFDAVDTVLTDRFFGALAMFLVALERGERALVDAAIAELAENVAASEELNLVPQWWINRIAIHLLSDLWDCSFHDRLPIVPAGGDAPTWPGLRTLFLAVLHSRRKAELELWPSQIDAAARSVNQTDDLVVSLPTSAGKTRIAELCILRCLAADKRIVFVTPLRALSAQTEIRSQRRVSRSGRTLGGGRLAEGALYHILKARVYIGEVTHNGKSYPGQHQGIIDAETFDQVQQLLARNAEARQAGEHAAQPSLLAYLVWDGLGRRMSPNHTRRRGRVHQYYASRQTTREERAAAAWRVSAADLEEVVVGALVHRLRHREAMRDVLLEMSDVQAIQETFDRAAMLADDIISASALEKRQLIANLIRRVTVRKEKVEILICLDGLCPDGIELTDGRETEELLTVAARITRAGSRSVLAIAPSQVMANQRQDLPLIKLVTKAYAARLRVETEPVDPKELARTTGQDKDYFARLVRLGYLAPDIITAILEGRQPPTLTRQHLARVSKLPLDWAEQRQLLGFASA